MTRVSRGWGLWTLALLLVLTFAVAAPTPSFAKGAKKKITKVMHKRVPKGYHVVCHVVRNAPRHTCRPACRPSCYNPCVQYMSRVPDYRVEVPIMSPVTIDYWPDRFEYAAAAYPHEVSRAFSKEPHWYTMQTIGKAAIPWNGGAPYPYNPSGMGAGYAYRLPGEGVWNYMDIPYRARY